MAGESGKTGVKFISRPGVGGTPALSSGYGNGLLSDKLLPVGGASLGVLGVAGIVGVVGIVSLLCDLLKRCGRSRPGVRGMSSSLERRGGGKTE